MLALASYIHLKDAFTYYVELQMKIQITWEF